MVGEWLEVAIGELAEIFDGPHATPRKTNDGPVFLGISNLAHGRLDLSNIEHLSEEDYVRWTRRVEPQAGDVVFSYETRLGEAASIPPGFRSCLGRRMGLLRARPGKVDKRFLLYAYLGPQFQETLRSRTIHGSTVDRIPLIEMPQFPIEVPVNIDEQRAIAHILGTLDDRIELNLRMNETLEAMARALFKSWFVDFDPVRAKAEDRDHGLPQSLADLFPDSFEDSELGRIPKGWSATPLYNIATYINGAAYAAFQPNDERRGFPIIKIAELKAGVTAQTKFSDVQMAEKYRIAEGDMLFSWSGNPDTSIDTFVWSDGKAWLNQHIFRVAPLRQNERPFVLSTLKTLRPIFAEIARNKQTTGLGHVTAEDMKRLLVARPDHRVMEAWHTVASPLHARTVATACKNRALAILRDTLLPMLISGELRVRGVERVIKEAIA